nr:hypothetical protein [Nocardioides sp. B-3]
MTYVEGNRGIEFFQGHQQRRHPRLRGDPDPDRRRRQQADRQGRERRGHRLRCRPVPPVLQGGRRQQRGRRQPEDPLRPAGGVLLGAEGPQQRRHRHPLARRTRHPRQRHRCRSPDDPVEWQEAAGRGTRRQAGVDLDRCRHRDHRRRRRPQLGAGEPRGAVRRGRPGDHLPADQGHQQLLRSDRWRRLRARVGDRQAPARWSPRAW